MTDDDPLAGLLPEPSLSFRSLPADARASLEVGARYRHHGERVSTRDVRLATDNFSDPEVIAILGSGD